MARHLRALLAIAALLALVATIALTSRGPQELPGIYVIDWDATVARIDEDNALKRNEVRARQAFTKSKGMDGFEFEIRADHTLETRSPGPRREEFNREFGAWKREGDRLVLIDDDQGGQAMNDKTSIQIIDGGLVFVGEMRADTDFVLRRK
jgi:hypothetical protein